MNLKWFEELKPEPDPSISLSLQYRLECELNRLYRCVGALHSLIRLFKVICEVDCCRHQNTTDIHCKANPYFDYHGFLDDFRDGTTDSIS